MDSWITKLSRERLLEEIEAIAETDDYNVIDFVIKWVNTNAEYEINEVIYQNILKFNRRRLFNVASSGLGDFAANKLQGKSKEELADIILIIILNHIRDQSDLVNIDISNFEGEILTSLEQDKEIFLSVIEDLDIDKLRDILNKLRRFKQLSPKRLI